MNNFLFITHITPKTKRSVFRQELIDIYYQALKNQKYDDWNVLIFGDEEKTEGKFNYFILPDGSSESKAAAVKKLLENKSVTALLEKADYIIKLDDDDIISPGLLNHLKDFQGDIFYDLYHTFIDSSSGIITQQERSWMASTCVHKKEHILSKWDKEGASSVGNLLYSDHSKSWHLYYANKKKKIADPAYPIYLRVLSPTSITSGALHGPPKTIADVDMQRYYQYLNSFGNWKQKNVSGFADYVPLISNAWRNFSGEEQKPLPKNLLEKSILMKLKSIKNVFGKRTG